MPRKVTAWGCEHGCRRRVLTDRKAMERHEATCWMNPARRTCKTCRHEEFYPGCGPDYYTGHGGDEAERECALGIEIECPPGTRGLPIATDCERWEPKP